MKIRSILIASLLIVHGILFSQKIDEKQTNINTPYFGEIPNETIPEIFALGFISSTDQEHSSLSFSPDGKELWWSIWKLPYDLDKYPQLIKYIKFENEKWSKVQTAPFSGIHRDGGPSFSPDGNKIYFYSKRPHDEISTPNNNIWCVERNENGWSQPVCLGEAINTEHVEACPYLSSNGNLYFTSNRNQYEDPTGNSDIFVSKFINGVFQKAEVLSGKINTAYARESYPYIAPDEDYIIFSRDSRHFDSERNYLNGDRKLMISFRDEQGKWREAIDMGERFMNTRFPSVSPDGKYLFFTKYSEETSEDFYWVDANIIDDLRPK